MLYFAEYLCVVCLLCVLLCALYNDDELLMIIRACSLTQTTGEYHLQGGPKM